MSSDITALIDDVVDAEAAASEDSMLRYLQQSVASRRRIRTVKRLAVASVASVFTALFAISMLNDNRLAEELQLVEFASQSLAPPILSIVSNTVAIKYVVDVPAIEIVPTRRLIVTTVNDRELEEVFFERAYAFLEDENSSISAFHILDAQFEEKVL